MLTRVGVYKGTIPYSTRFSEKLSPPRKPNRRFATFEFTTKILENSEKLTPFPKGVLPVCTPWLVARLIFSSRFLLIGRHNAGLLSVGRPIAQDMSPVTTLRVYLPPYLGRWLGWVKELIKRWYYSCLASISFPSPSLVVSSMHELTKTSLISVAMWPTWPCGL